MFQKYQKKILLIVVIALVLVLSIVGVSFAYYMIIIRGENVNSISTAKVNLFYTEQSTPLKSIDILSDTYGAEYADEYNFSIEGISTEKAIAKYAIYLEPDEKNTLDDNLISVSITNGDGSLIYPYTKQELRCYDYENNTSISSEICSPDDLVEMSLSTTTEEIDPLSNEYNASQLITAYKYDDNNPEICRKYSYYSVEKTKILYEHDVEVDTSNCRYGNKKVDVPSAKSLVGAGSYYEEYIINGTSNKIETNINTATIYEDKINLNKENNYRETNLYTLKIWVSKEKLEQSGVIEGKIVGDDSIKVELGADAIFKFKIAVYSKSISAVD